MLISIVLSVVVEAAKLTEVAKYSQRDKAIRFGTEIYDFLLMTIQ